MGHMNKPKTTFWGSDEFSLPILEAIFKILGRNLVLVITEPDRPSSRGKKPVTNPVKMFAIKNNITIIEKDNKLGELADKVKDTDLAVVASFGKLIPKALLDLPKPQFINVHYSLLPRWRGASPVQQTILEGDKIAGVTVIELAEKLDTGPIILKDKLNDYTGKENFTSLRDKFSKLAVKQLSKLLKEMPPYSSKPQPKSKITLAGKIKKSDGQINFKNSPVEIERQIRAFKVWPTSYTIVGDKRVIIESADISSKYLIIRQLKVEGRPSMSGSDFANGYPNLLTFFPDWVKFEKVTKQVILDTHVKN